ncbi:hypothetical protein L6R50_22895 [Myxococcota bacterium]|nr:hypothetical protein [Myxococcota bacterium]
MGATVWRVLAVGLVMGCSGDPGGDAVADDDSAGDDDSSPADDDVAVDGDDAEVVSTALPAALSCGASHEARIALRNAGEHPWTREDGYKLGAVDDSDPFYTTDTRVWLPEGVTVAPGETWEFVFTLTASAPGTYTTDWRMVKEGAHWFGATAAQDVEVTCEPTAARTGLVRLEGHSLVDDQGPFNALGATMMWAAWAYRNDREKLERDLLFLSQHGFHYVRALGVVGDPDGEDYWDGREIDEAWPDYDAVIAGLTDLAYDGYGLRVEWTLIGDGQVTVPTSGEKYALADRFLAMSQGREHKIVHFEVANEYWQNGFEGTDGLEELRELTVYLRDRTDVLVAASAPAGHECEDGQAVYGGGVADLATVHFDRDTSYVEGGWRPVRQPWEWEYCEDVPVGSNNEPIGPGSSVDTEEDPTRLVAAAIATYVSNLPLYVFHSSAGVRGDTAIADMSGAGSFVHVAGIVPPDLASWDRKNAHWDDSPFVVYAEDASGTLWPDTMWVDLADPAGGAVRAYGGVSGDSFFVFPIGILGRVFLEPRRAMEVEVVDPLTGSSQGTTTRAAGERFELAGAEALVLRGRFLE